LSDQLLKCYFRVIFVYFAVSPQLETQTEPEVLVPVRLFGNAFVRVNVLANPAPSLNMLTKKTRNGVFLMNVTMKKVSPAGFLHEDFFGCN
jgi:hypothetical protein